jgi:hypothetical protein
MKVGRRIVRLSCDWHILKRQDVVRFIGDLNEKCASVDT